MGGEGGDGAQERAFGAERVVLDEALQVAVEAAEDGPVAEALSLLQQEDLANLLLDGAQSFPLLAPAFSASTTIVPMMPGPPWTPRAGPSRPT